MLGPARGSNGEGAGRGSAQRGGEHVHYESLKQIPEYKEKKCTTANRVPHSLPKGGGEGASLSGSGLKGTTAVPWPSLEAVAQRCS